MSNQKAVLELAISAGMVVAGVGTFISGMMGVYERRSTVAALYLDARVWWSRNLGAGRAKHLAEEAAAQAARRSDAVQIEDDGSVSLYSETDPGSGLEVYSWRDSVSGAPLCAVGHAAAANYCPRTIQELAAFEPAPCPFVLLTYVSARGEERTIPDADPRLWYRRRPDFASGSAAAGVPKFTADEVHFLLCRGRPENASVWTPEEYTLECTTADGEDLVLSQKQVFWTVPPQHHPPPPAAAAAEPLALETVAEEEDEKEEEETAAAAKMDEEEAATNDEETTAPTTVAEEEGEAPLAESAAAPKRAREEEVDEVDEGDEVDEVDDDAKLMPPPKKLPRRSSSSSDDADYLMTAAAARRAVYDRIMADMDIEETANEDGVVQVEVFDDLDFAAVD